MNAAGIEVSLFIAPDAAQVDFVWQPIFGSPWAARERIARLRPEEAEKLVRGQALELELEPGKAPTMLKPVVIEGERCIEGFRALAGATDPTAALPGTIRGDLGRDWGEKVQKNIVHGSDSPESAEREIGIWFPEL